MAGSGGASALKALAFELAAHVAQQLIVDEAPAAVAPGAADGVALGVVRLSAAARPVDLRAPPYVSARIGEDALGSALAHAQLSIADELRLELVDFPTAPEAERPPPPEAAFATAKVASAVASLRILPASGVAVPAMSTTTTNITAHRRLDATGDTVASDDEAAVTTLVLPRTAGYGYCSRHYQCRGPRGIIVDGRCRNRQCECPLPWAGAGCKAHTRCAWWASEFSWQYEHCQLDVGASSAEVAVCRCAVVGTFDVAVVESGKGSDGWIISLNVELQSWDDLLDDIEQNPTVLILVLSVDVLWLIAVIAAKCRGNESERRKHKDFYAFWAAQHKQRVATAAKPGFWKRLKTQLRAQHKLVRISYPPWIPYQLPPRRPFGFSLNCFLIDCPVTCLLEGPLADDRLPLG